jgi:fused signal recognition particle receptor
VLIMDTAGRLQNRKELMAELEKVVRVMRKVDAAAPHAVLLVLDATVGQNALAGRNLWPRGGRHRTGDDQARWHGARRHSCRNRREAQALPVHFIGVGEGIDDLEPFTRA